MAKVERIYNVPLRKGFIKAVRYKKAKKAVTTLKEFLAQHMKCDIKDVRLGKHVNQKIWEQGIKSPPHHVKVSVVKDDSGVVNAELFGFKYEEFNLSEDKKDEKVKKETKPAVKKEETKETKTKDAATETKKPVVKPKAPSTEKKVTTEKPVAKKASTESKPAKSLKK